MGKATNPRINPRSKGGRPRQQGERYPSGKLKAVKPNPVVLARRALICADPAMATCPLDASYANGWITQAEYGAGRAFLAVHVSAGLDAPGAAAMRDNSIPRGAADELRQKWGELSDAQVLAMRWNEFTDKEIAAIWDSALRHMGRLADPAAPSEFAVRAHQRWRAMNAALSSIERVVVDSFCVRAEWPQWFVERLEGRYDTVHEERRDILVSGLRAIGQAMRKPKAPVRRDLALPDPKPARGPVIVERTEIVDDSGEVVQVHERIRRA